jgi:RNA polymerase sigma-70 factor (ECF subfamily)
MEPSETSQARRGDDPLAGRHQAEEAEIRAALAGRDTARAFALLVEHYGDRFYGFIRHMVGDDDAAEELWQRVLVTAHRTIGRAPAHTTLRAWLYRLARDPMYRKLGDMARKRAEFAPSYAWHPYEDPASDDEFFTRLEHGTSRPRDYLRMAFLLRYQERFSYEEMEGICDASAVELRKQVATVLRRVRISVDSTGRLT